MTARAVSTNHRSWHGTLAAGVEDVVTFDRDVNLVRIYVESGTAPVYYTTDGRAAAVPAANTSNSSGVVPVGGTVVVDCEGTGNAVVRVISAAIAVFHITDAS